MSAVPADPYLDVPALPPPAEPIRQVPPPMSFAELRLVEEPEERDIAEGLLPADANLLVTAYPKSFKTFFLCETGVAATTATPLLQRFHVPRVHRVGLVLMEDAKHRVLRRIERMCLAHDVDPDVLATRLHLWFRPPLRLADAKGVADMKHYAADLGLDLLAIDNWAYVATGNSNDADDVSPQLAAFSSIREANPGMSVLLVQHARKQAQDRSGERLTDIIRNSSAFGAWYDAGILLSRPDEHSPVNVRVEMRDRPAPAAFSFTVEDEVPGDDRRMPSGYLRLAASDVPAAVLQQRADAVPFKGPVLAFLRDNPGVSKAALKKGVPGDNLLVEAAFNLLCQEGAARYDAPPKKGIMGHCFALPGGNLADLAATSLQATSEGTSLTSLHPPKGGARQRGTATLTTPTSLTARLTLLDLEED
jgi:hypothetical protein